MKHIFTIHSSLTFLVAYTTTRHLNLRMEDCVFLNSRYKVPVKGLPVFPSYYDANHGILKKILQFNVPKAFDRYINSIIGDEKFIAYIDLMSYYQKLLVTHKNCEQFHFFEEGNSTFQVNDNLTDITWHERRMEFREKYFSLKSLVRVLRGYNLRILSLPYIYTAYIHMKNIRFFSLSENAYYNAPNEKKVIMRPELNDEKIADMAANFYLENQVIWLDGSNSRYTGLDESYYHDAVQKAIVILKNRNVIHKKVYVKLRPGIKDYSQNKLVSILKENGVEVEVMPDNMIIVCFFLLSKNCHVLGTLTSALEYAHIFGHKTYSIYGLFEKQPATFFDRMEGFWNNLENLREE